MSTMSLQALVSDYLAHCRAKGLSPKTLKDNYGYALNEVFLPWCERQGLGALDDLSNRVLDRYSAELQERGGKRGRLSEATVATYVEAVEWMLNWAHREGDLEKRLRVQTPQIPRRVLEVLSREELQAMEDCASTERDKLIVRVLADTGLRVGELLGLTENDLVERGRNRYMLIRHRSSGGGVKGNAERLVPIQPGLHKRLARLARGRPADTQTARLFVGLRRRPDGRYGALTASGVEQLIRTLAERAGIGRRVYPHLLRHSFATWALTRRMDPVTLSRTLGHSSLAMIQRNYAHMTSDDMHEAMMALLREN